MCACVFVCAPFFPQFVLSPCFFGVVVFLVIGFYFFHTQTELLSISIAWNAVLTVFAIQFNTRSHLKSIKKNHFSFVSNNFFCCNASEENSESSIYNQRNSICKTFCFLFRSFISFHYLFASIYSSTRSTICFIVPVIQSSNTIETTNQIVSHLKTQNKNKSSATETQFQVSNIYTRFGRVNVSIVECDFSVWFNRKRYFEIWSFNLRRHMKISEKNLFEFFFSLFVLLFFFTSFRHWITTNQRTNKKKTIFRTLCSESSNCVSRIARKKN